MNEFISILLLMFTAILAENFIFAKFYGICPFLGVSEKPDTALGMGLAVTFVITLSSAATWVIYTYVLLPLQLAYLKTVAFILIIAALVQLIEMFLRRYIPALYQAFVEMVIQKMSPALYNALGIYLPLITTNCAVLGVALLNIQKEYTFVYSVAYGFASAIGFLFAIVLFAGVRMRLRLADPPKAFAGLPLVLITAGLIAMAFSGFSGIRFA